MSPSFVLLAAKAGEAAKSGPIGLAVIILLCVACYFLFKSMSKHLRKVRDDFPADPPVTDRPADGSGEHADRAEEPHRSES